MYQMLIQMLIERALTQLVGTVDIHMLQSASLEDRVREIHMVIDRVAERLSPIEYSKGGIVH